VVADEDAQAIDSAQALMSWSNGHVTLDVRLSLPAGTGGLWLLPLPTGATAEVIEGETLNTLAHWDTPTVTVMSRSPDAAGCDDTSDSTTLLSAEGTREFPTEEGDFDVVGVLVKPSLNSLSDWLEERGQSLPASLETRLGGALSGGKDLVWAALSPGDSPRFTPTLRVRFHQLPDAKQPLPLSLSRVEGQGRYDLLLHVLSDKRYRVENYPSVEASQLGEHLSEQAQSPQPYQAAMDAMADEAGGSLVVAESADILSGSGPLADLISGEADFLTRLHLRSSPERLVDATIAFAKDGPPLSPEVQVTLGGDTAASIPLWVLLVGLGARARRRRTAQGRDRTE
jgi:hypothetical protein